MPFTLTVAALVALAGCANAATPPEIQTFYIKDWPETCNTGMKQTPIDIIPADVEQLPEALQFEVTMPTITGVQVSNKGNALQVDFDNFTQATQNSLPTVPSAGAAVSAIFSDPANGADTEVQLRPIQFHFHAVSEHTVDGLYYPMEAHIVCLVAQGSAPAEWGCDAFWQSGNTSDINLENCASVFGVLFKGGSTSPDWFTTFLQAAPDVVGESADAGIAEFDMMNLIPENPVFYTYEGSLTTPGCNEGLRWHVFAEPLTVAHRDMEALQTWQANTKASANANAPIAVFRDDHRPIQELNGRSVWYSGTLPATSPACNVGGSSSGGNSTDSPNPEGGDSALQDAPTTGSASAVSRIISVLAAAVAVVLLVI